jgi:hypothetical protein
MNKNLQRRYARRNPLCYTLMNKKKAVEWETASSVAFNSRRHALKSRGTVKLLLRFSASAGSRLECFKHNRTEFLQFFTWVPAYLRSIMFLSSKLEKSLGPSSLLASDGTSSLLHGLAPRLLSFNHTRVDDSVI